MYYDNPYWEYHLPINPAISSDDIDPASGEAYDYVGLASCEVANWLVDGIYVFQPELKENIQHD